MGKGGLVYDSIRSYLEKSLCTFGELLLGIIYIKGPLIECISTDVWVMFSEGLNTITDVHVCK